MGVLNITPDSFSDGGRFLRFHEAVAHARRMVEEGADIIDLGGESSRPGAVPVSAEEELRRVLPVIEAVHREVSVPISIDTSKPEVMIEAIAAGASMVNDITALRQPGALDAVRNLDVSICLMHMQGTPCTMQSSPRYDNVLTEVVGFLSERVEHCIAMGIAPERLIVDPGFGFGKTHGHNLELLANLDVLVAAGYPVMVGLSRKSMIGAILGRSVDERAIGSVALAMIAASHGAAILRVHDVAQTRDAIRILERVSEWRDGTGRNPVGNGHGRETILRQVED